MTKDSSPCIRSACVVGLSRIGVSTLRTLLIGLYDSHSQVKRVVESEIQRYSKEIVIEEYFNTDKRSQISSLKFSIKDILDKKLYVTIGFCRYLEKLYSLILFNENEESYKNQKNEEEEDEEEDRRHDNNSNSKESKENVEYDSSLYSKMKEEFLKGKTSFN